MGALTVASPWVGEPLVVVLPERTELGRRVGAARRRLRDLGGQSSRQRLAAQPGAGLRMERSHPQLFRVLPITVEVAIVAAKPTGGPQSNPPGPFVTGSLIPRGIDEALGHQHGVAVAGDPVVGQPAGATGEQVAGEIGLVGAFGQQEKTAVLREEAQPRGALGFGPAKPAITRSQVQRGAGPAEESEPAAGGRDGDVAQRFADERRVVEVVLFAEHGVEARTLLRP